MIKIARLSQNLSSSFYHPIGNLNAGLSILI